jgi:prolyl 4-hydroxylase
MNLTLIAPGIRTIDTLLSTAECEAVVERAEGLGFEAAPLNTADGAAVVATTRNNERCMFDDPALAAQLWARAQSAVPSALSGRQAIGLNERFRIYRYHPGQRFYWHTDAPFRRDNGEMSLLTFIVYLNDNYTGGETRFVGCEIIGSQGKALIFQHGLMHEGAEVTRGSKYALRSDVMFGPLGRYYSV